MAMEFVFCEVRTQVLQVLQAHACLQAVTVNSVHRLRYKLDNFYS